MPSIFRFNESGEPAGFDSDVLDRMTDDELVQMSTTDLDDVLAAGEDIILDDNDGQGGDDPARTADRDESWITDLQGQGVPREWLIDPTTNEPYENGLIRGKYKSPVEAFRGELHRIGVLDGDGLGPRAVEMDTEPDDPTIPPPPPGPDEIRQQYERRHQTLQLDARQAEAIKNHAFRLAGEDMKDALDAEGVPVPETAEEWDEFKTTHPGLARQWEVAQNYHTQRGAEYVEQYHHYSTHRDAYNSQAMAAATEDLIEAVRAATQLEPTEQDLEVIGEHATNLLTEVHSWLQNADPSDPAVLTLCDVQAGVPVLNAEKLSRAVRAASHEFLLEAVRQSTEARVQQQRRGIVDDAPRRFPTSLAEAGGDGRSGSSTGIMSEDELFSADAIDRLAEQFNGDETAALREYERQVQAYDRKLSQAGRY